MTTENEWLGRGWIEVMQNGDGFTVYDWSEHYDSGACLGDADTVEDAFAIARAAQVVAPWRRIVVLGETLAEHRKQTQEDIF